MTAVRSVRKKTAFIGGKEERKRKMGILEELKERVLLFDGGMGSLLQERGLRPGELPES